MALLSHGGEVATDATKGRRASLAAKGPGDFLLNFHHPQILLGPIVGKWHPEVGHEPQDGLGIALEPIQEILGLRLLDPSPMLVLWQRGRLGSQPGLDELMVGCAEANKAVLLVSSYLPELFGMCDRLAVMCRGRLSPARPIDRWTPELVLQTAIGAEAA